MVAENLVTVRTLEDFQALKDYVDAQSSYTSFDVETTGTDPESEMIGFSICAELDLAFYVVTSYWDVAAQTLVATELKTPAIELLSALAAKNLIAHNAGFDCAMTDSNYGVKLIQAIHTDTMILAHLLDENRGVGLKDLALSIFGEESTKEQAEMKASVIKNGGIWQDKTGGIKEMYKADSEVLARYGAKDALLTLKLFYHLVPELYEQGLDQFFYEDESMPLLKGPTYEMNTSGLRVDPDKLQKLKQELETENLELKAFVYKEITPLVANKYPGTSKKTQFNIGASQQMAWLMFEHLEQEFGTLTDSGKDVCKYLGMKLPYTAAAKRLFIREVKDNKGRIMVPAGISVKTGKKTQAKKIKDPWTYMQCGKEVLGPYAKKYVWVEKLLKHAKNEKLLSTYVEGIQERMKYNIIRPNFLQHGTTSGRYSCKNPNFQNLPRDDKRVKACIIARPGKVLVGSDYSQLEPRVFASVSGDERLCNSFASGQDFYSVIGIDAFGKYDAEPFKEGPKAFGALYKALRNSAKVFSLATPYGALAPQLARGMGKSIQEAQEIKDAYFEQYPKVKQMMLDSHEMAKTQGYVTNLFGRPRRIPKALEITTIYGNTKHENLPSEARTILNLAMNHRVQSTGASIMNRAAIAVWKGIQVRRATDARWNEVKIILQVHDQLVLEGPIALGNEMAALLKDCMENATTLPGVVLEAKPFITNNLAEQG